MMERRFEQSSSPRPRVLALGSLRDPLRMPDAGLVEALRPAIDLRRLGVDGGLRSAPHTFARALAAVRREQFELVHIFDPRLAPIGKLMRRLADVPVSVSLTSVDVESRAPLSRLGMRAAASLDQAFTSDDATAATLREIAPRLALATVQPAAEALPWPSRAALSRVSRALRGVRPGRLVVAVPWPENRNDLRWFRDFVTPQIESRPIILLMGAPSRRDARLLVGHAGLRATFRVLTGRPSGDLIAAVARCVDAFALAATSSDRTDPPGHLAMALATGGVPLVTHEMLDDRVLAHERNAFVVAPDDEHGYVHILNQVLGLPAVQRHFLGEEFARFTLSRWRWEDAAAVYADRFAALVGRPQIPLDLRAAA
jgi:glycosyltransferase involved in cell wall biosynthesis